LINAAQVLGRELTAMKVVINGAGAAGTAIARLLRCVGHDPSVCNPVKEIVVCDSQGAIHRGRENLAPYKQELLAYTNREDRTGSLQEVLRGADVFIGVSRGNLLQGADVREMASDPVILAMANPIPEIMPDVAREAGAAIVGTGRSDFPNQVNNVLAFPGLFRGALDSHATSISEAMKLAAAQAIAACIDTPTAEKVLPNPLDQSVAPRVAAAVRDAGCTPHVD